jgi:hypothetical protein
MTTNGRDVIAELSFEPQIRHEQELPMPDPEDHAEAERKVERAVNESQTPIVRALRALVAPTRRRATPRPQVN